MPGRVYSNDVLANKGLKTVQGGTLNAAVKDGAATINGAGIVAADIDASNGVIHVIDAVLLPPAATAKGAQVIHAVPQYVHVQPATQYGSYVCPQTGRVISYQMQTAHRR